MTFSPSVEVSASPSATSSAALRVLLISHTCQSKTEGQPRAVQLSRFSDIDLRVLTPARWRHYGKWRQADLPGDEDIQIEAGRVAWPWVGPAQFYLHWYPELRRILCEFRPDVIDIWEEPWALVAAQACWLRNRLLPEARIVIETEQNIDKTLPPPFGWLRSYTLANSDFAVARSGEALDVIRRRGYAGPSQLVPNAVNAELFHPMPAFAREAARREMALSGCVVGYAGRLVKEKGILDLVEAIAMCPPDVCLVIVGDGPLEQELRRRVDDKGVGDRVRLLGAKDPSALARVFGAMDMLALPSRTTRRWKEQFGRVIIEAHACGVPVIGSDSGAIPQVVGRGGLIFPEGNVPALAAAIQTIRGDLNAAREMGLAGRRQVEERYTWRRVADKFREAYLAAARRSRALRSGSLSRYAGRGLG